MPTWPHGGGRLLNDALVIQAGRALQVLFNLCTFVMLALALGPREFGVFSTIVAVIAAGSALADLGLGQLAVRAVAQAQHAEIAGIHSAIPYLYAASAALLVVSCAISWGLTGIGLKAVAATLLVGTAYLLTQARIGVERGLWLGALHVTKATGIELIASALRTTAVGLVWLTGGVSVLHFAWGIALSGVASLVVVLQWLRYTYAAADTTSGWSARRTIRESIPFGLSSLTWNTFAELPKLFLAPVAGAVAVGQYAAGSRFLAAATLPLQSVLSVVTPRLFAAAHASSGARETRMRSFARSLLAITALGTVFALAMVVLAPVVPIILGADYLPAVPVLRMLALSLPFQGLAFAAGDWLGGLGRQTLRLLLTVATLALAGPVLVLSVSAAGALGAAASFAGLCGVLGVATTIACWRLLRR